MRFADWLAAAVFAAALLILLACLLAGRFPVLDLAALAMLPAVWGSIAAALWLIVRMRGMAGKVLVGGCLLPVLPLLARAPPPAAACAPAAPKLRIAWINVQGPAEPMPVANWIARERPQIVGLAELHADAARLRGFLASRYPHGATCLDNGRCSTVLYAKVRPRAVQALARGDPENRQALSAVSMTFATPESGRAIQVLAAHLSRPLQYRRQHRELAQISAALRPSADTIVLGDFNMSPRMRVLKAFAARNGLRIVETGGPTWPARLGGWKIAGLWQIDQLLAGRGWKVAAIRRSPDLGSDHRGYVADLCRPDEG